VKLLSILRSPDQLPLLKEAGCDGILVGIEGLSYRIETYTLDLATDIQCQAKALGLNVFLCLNRLLDEDEIGPAKEQVENLLQLSFDGIYFQDLAYVHFCSGKNIPLIYAPEAIITNKAEVEVLCSNGIDRVLVAKELTLEEILQIAENNPHKVELFGFGHLPMSVSRRPLVRNYLTEINADIDLSQGTGNRLKEEKRSVHYPVYEDKKETVLFADSVFCALNELCRLSKSGVVSIIADDLFVEERMLCEFIKSCKSVLEGADPLSEMNRLSLLAPKLVFSSGYFYKKTNLTKEGTVV
jgi:U32 family peptidase